MACCQLGAKSLPGPMLTYCQLDPLEQTSVKFQLKKSLLPFNTMHWKMSSAKCWPFCSGLNASTSIPEWYSMQMVILISNIYLQKNAMEQCGKPNFLSTRPETDVTYMFYTKFHLPKPIFYSPSSKCTRIGERASVSFHHWWKLPILMSSLPLSQIDLESNFPQVSTSPSISKQCLWFVGLLPHDNINKSIGLTHRPWKMWQ